MQRMHDEYGHLTPQSLANVLESRAWWPTIKKDLKAFAAALSNASATESRARERICEDCDRSFHTAFSEMGHRSNRPPAEDGKRQQMDCHCDRLCDGLAYCQGHSKCYRGSDCRIHLRRNLYAFRHTARNLHRWRKELVGWSCTGVSQENWDAP